MKRNIKIRIELELTVDPEPTDILLDERDAITLCVYEYLDALMDDASLDYEIIENES